MYLLKRILFTVLVDTQAEGKSFGKGEGEEAKSGGGMLYI